MTPSELIDEMHKVWHPNYPEYLYREIVDPKQERPKYRYIFQYNRKVALYLQTIYDRYNLLRKKSFIQVKLQYRIPEYANKPLVIEIPVSTPEGMWKKISSELSEDNINSWIDKLENQTRSQALAEKIARDLGIRYAEFTKDLPIRVFTYPNQNNPNKSRTETSIYFTDLTEQQILNLINIIKQWCIDNRYDVDNKGE